jgi:hypothetical protein
MSKPTVLKALKALTDAKLIRIRARYIKGKKERDRNLYVLLNVPKVVNDVDHVVKEIDNGGKGDLPQVVNDVDSKKTQLKKTQLKRLTEKRAAANDAPPAHPTEHKDEQPVTASVKADPVPARHPFVEIYRETFHRYPAGAQTAHLEKSVGAAADSSKWREVCEAWLMAGYKPVNLAGMLDWYHKGIPQHRSNVPARASPKNEYAHAPPARDEEAIARTRAAFDAGQIPGYVPEILKRKNA